MAKILILANHDLGLYRFRRELIERLVQEHEVFAALPYGNLIPDLEKLGCHCIETSLNRRGTNPFQDLKLLRHYIKMLKNVKPDVVLTYTIKPNIYGGLACRITGAPYIANITGLGTAVENGGILQKISLRLYKLALKDAKCIFFQNKENKEFFVRKIGIDKKSRIIPGSGVNLNYYSVLDYPSDETIRFLFIARVMKEKGIEEYLEAAQFIRKKYPNTEFHILGFCEDAYEERLRSLQDKGVVIYHGTQNDVREYHKISHCVIHPTFYPEGMSNVLLESAACGRPVITTDRAGCKEIVDDGINGFLVNQQDSQDLIEKIEKFIHLDFEKKKSMGLSGRKKVENEFDRQIVVDSYLEEINDIVG